jgi:hypothetical protein
MFVQTLIPELAPPLDLSGATLAWLELHLSRISFTATVPRTEAEALKWFVGDAMGLALIRSVSIHAGGKDQARFPATMHVRISDSLSKEDVTRLTGMTFSSDGRLLRFSAISAETELVAYGVVERFLEITYANQ